MSIIFGLIIVISSIFMIRRELNRAIIKREQLLAHSKFYKEEDLFSLIENMQISIDEMNNAFYNIASDLEGKYSQHEKEIQLLDEKLTSLLSQPKVSRDKNEPKIKQTDRIEMHKAEMDLNKSKMEREKESKLMIQQEPVDSESVLTLRNKVLQLRSEGLSLKAIAKELDIGMGELQLLIQLPDVTKKT